MLANYVRESDGVLAILSGASALILPSMGSRQGLVDAILRVAKGETILPNGVIARLNGLASNATGRLDEEERRVLRLITEGSTDEEIGAKEAVPLVQVRSWVAGIGEKLS
jgi:DNA-binding NarL/FixJ family response regulator